MLGTRGGRGVLCLPPEETPNAKRNRQSWGHSIVLGSRRPLAESLSRSPCVPLKPPSQVKRQSWAWLYPLSHCPLAFYAICSGTCSLAPPALHRHSFPEHSRRRAPAELPTKETKYLSPTLY